MSHPLSSAGLTPNGILTRSMIERISKATSFDDAIGILLDDVIALLGAEYGNVQLACDGDLLLVEQRGFAEHFLSAFHSVSIRDAMTVCARSARARKQVVVPDIRLDPEYASLMAIADQAGYRAVQSTPLFTSNGMLIGVLSTHFRNPRTPTAMEMQALREYSIFAADHVHALLNGGSLCAKAHEMSGRNRKTA
jgi:GAF domain-containing protein